MSMSWVRKKIVFLPLHKPFNVIFLINENLVSTYTKVWNCFILDKTFFITVTIFSRVQNGFLIQKGKHL